MERLVATLGITQLSKSQVGEMARDLDGQVEALRTRPLDAGPDTFVAADALVLKVREGGRTVNVHAMIATGANAGGPGDPGSARHHQRGRRRMAVGGVGGAEVPVKQPGDGLLAAVSGGVGVGELPGIQAD
jgi:Transposase, Mutator family